HTRDEFVARIKAFAATVPAGTWITGGDWDHSLWGGELPTHEWIDAVAPDHPVWVNRLDGHMSRARPRMFRAARSCAIAKANRPGFSRTTRCRWSMQSCRLPPTR